MLLKVERRANPLPALAGGVRVNGGVLPNAATGFSGEACGPVLQPAGLPVSDQAFASAIWEWACASAAMGHSSATGRTSTRTPCANTTNGVAMAAARIAMQFVFIILNPFLRPPVGKGNDNLNYCGQ